MTKKDYKVIAEVIRKEYVSSGDDRKRIVKEITIELAEVLHSNNLKFDYDKFYTACGF